MSESKELVVKKEGFFSKIINKLKGLFGKHDIQEIKKIENESILEDCKEDKKKDFLNNIKAEGNSEILSLKTKLENGEVKSIDLTDEQIDELQAIYDKEIEENKEKLEKIKYAT